MKNAQLDYWAFLPNYFRKINYCFMSLPGFGVMI